MNQVRLYPQDDGGMDLPGTSANTVHLPELRIRLWVRLANDPFLRQAVLDTGATACVLSHEIWEPFHKAGRIEWISHPPGESSTEPLPRIGLLHSRFPYRLGKIDLRIEDMDGGSLESSRVTVICTEQGRSDPEPLPRVLLVGLLDVLNGRTLSLSASPDGSSWTGTLSESP